MLPIHKELRDDVLRVRTILNAVGRGSGAQVLSFQRTEYKTLRDKLIQTPGVAAKVPECVKACHDLPEFWAFIRPMFPTYNERTAYLFAEFKPLLTYLETPMAGPADKFVASHLERLSSAMVQATWMRALERKASDPEGSITLARSLVESTIKHILDELQIEYGNSDDLPKLYLTVAKELNLAPSQHTEQMFKQVLQGCTSVVQGLGSIRSKLGDSHGTGKGAPRPGDRHAELTVSLAGAMAVFLIRTHEEQKTKVQKVSSRKEPATIRI